MEGNLVIVESPHKAKTIQDFLGEGYIVKSSRGHIRDLDEKGLSIDIAAGFKPTYVVPADKRGLVAELKRLAQDAQTVLLASDEDREGEAISWHLFETLGLRKENTKRIVFHEITESAIKHAVENPRDIDMNLVNAQQARRVLDRLVGFELSPVLWRKIQPKLSAGRVQSVALRLIVDREREILSFRNEPFYKVEAIFHPEGTAENVTVRATLDTRFSTLEQAKAYLQDCIGASFAISSIDRKEGVRTPAPPFTTSTLQQEAYRKLHMSVGTTMSVAQKLYEAGLITYMRTDSVNLSNLAINAAKRYISENFGEEYSKVRRYRTSDRGAQEAHEAIRPTYISRPSISGTPQEKKLYELIWKRTVASQMVDAKVLRTDIKVSSSTREEKFAVHAQQVLFDGFLKLYMEGSDDDQGDEDEVLLPHLETGTPMLRREISAVCKFTAPAPRYSQATLVKKLQELEIGRPSTYSTIISTLTKTRGYVINGDKEGVKMSVENLKLKDSKISSSRVQEVVGAEKGKLIPQEIGMIVSDYLTENFSSILDYGFTASVEQDFDLVAAGQKPWNALISDFYGPFHENVSSVMSNGEYSRVQREIGVDPSDGQMIVAKFGQFGPFVQKGEGDSRVFASLAPGQLIESVTLEEALKLFQLPRTVGSHEGIDIVCLKGRYGPYLKYGDKNISLPRGKRAESITLEECVALIVEAGNKPAREEIREFPGDIRIINGTYGPYIKHGGSNYRIPKGTDIDTLDEEACRKIISENGPTTRKKRRK